LGSAGPEAAVFQALLKSFPWFAQSVSFSAVLYSRRPNRLDRDLSSCNVIYRSKHACLGDRERIGWKEDREPLITGEDWLKVLKVIDAVFESSRRGSPLP